MSRAQVHPGSTRTLSIRSRRVSIQVPPEGAARPPQEPGPRCAFFHFEVSAAKPRGRCHFQSRCRVYSESSWINPPPFRYSWKSGPMTSLPKARRLPRLRLEFLLSCLGVSRLRLFPAALRHLQLPAGRSVLLRSLVRCSKAVLCRAQKLFHPPCRERSPRERSHPPSRIRSAQSSNSRS